MRVPDLSGKSAGSGFVFNGVDDYTYSNRIFFFRLTLNPPDVLDLDKPWAVHLPVLAAEIAVESSSFIMCHMACEAQTTRAIPSPPFRCGTSAAAGVHNLRHWSMVRSCLILMRVDQLLAVIEDEEPTL